MAAVTTFPTPVYNFYLPYPCSFSFLQFDRWCSGKEASSCQCRRHGYDPWVRRIPWSRKWQAIPVFLPGKFYGQRGLVFYSLWVAESWIQLSTHARNLTLEYLPLVFCWVIWLNAKNHKPGDTDFRGHLFVLHSSLSICPPGSHSFPLHSRMF